jgi:hypothetical protein
MGKGGALFFLFVLLASCSEVETIDGRRDTFAIATSKGIVEAVVEEQGGFEGAARLIRAGIAEAYAVECGPTDNAMPTTRHVIWAVARGGLRPTAMISVRVLNAGKIENAASASVAAPGAVPDAVFMAEVVHLALRVLPPPAKAPETPGDRCP